MFKRFIYFLVPLIVFTFSQTAAQEKLEDYQIEELLGRQVVLKNITGIAAAVIDENGTHFFGIGRINKKSNDSPDGNTIYEIGSITKVFTSLLLQKMADDGKLNLNDPISKFLPKSVKTPSKNGKEITLLDLSAQISGLPRMPDNFRPKDYQNPFADYTPEKLYEFLSSYKLTRDIGEKYEYSNVGAGLLGHILSLAGKSDYETLVEKYICEPLKMKSTFITFKPEFKKRLAQGYNISGNPVKNWDFSSLAGAGALKSCVNDLITFLKANMGLIKSDLYSSMLKIQKRVHDTGIPDLDIAMGWHIWKKFGKQIIWHNGGTYGYTTFIGFDNESKKGVIVLSNGPQGVDDIGLHLLDTRYELK